MKFEFKILDYEEPDLEQYQRDLCNALVDRAKLRTPERTGRLKRSIEGAVTKDSIELGSDVDYAPHVEYGTVNMSGHAMFRMALEDGQAISDAIKIEYKKVK